MSRRLVTIITLAVVMTSCASSEEVTDTPPASEETTTQPAPPPTQPPSTPMRVASSAFEEGQPIPVRFTCDGEDISPLLVIDSIPDRTAALALIVDDPDAPVGTWDHWVEYDIETANGGLTIAEDVGRLGVQGVNSWNRTGYGGPCPPPGPSHRYFFKVYALDVVLGIPEGVDSDGLRTAMEGHVLAEAQLMGTFAR